MNGDYRHVFRLMLPFTCVLLIVSFAVGWFPYFLGAQKHWYWALVASLVGPAVAIPVNFVSRLHWVRTKRKIEQAVLSSRR